MPIPVLLPPLLALLDSTHAPTRCRGLHVLQTVIDKTTAASTRTGTSRGWGGERGKWLNQTGLGEVLMKVRKASAPTRDAESADDGKMAPSLSPGSPSVPSFSSQTRPTTPFRRFT